MSDYLQNLLTNSFDNLSDMFGRKESRDSLLFETIKNSLSNPFDGPKYGMIVHIDGYVPTKTVEEATGANSNPTHPWVIKARIRPLGNSSLNLFNEEICKYKNDKAKLINAIHNSSKVAYSEALDGDETGFIPTIGDVVPIFYDIENPLSRGRERGLRYKLQRVRRAKGGLDGACIEALGGPAGDQITLSRLGTAGGVLGGPPSQGPEFQGTYAGNGKLPPEIAANWPSGVIGVKKGGKIKQAPAKAMGAAMKRREWWINNSGGDPNDVRVKYRRSNGKLKATKVKNVNIITIVDATLEGKEKNLWTYDVTDPQSPKLLVYAYGGIGYSSFKPGPSDGMKPGYNSRGIPADFANGNSHTSAGMKIFGGFRGYRKETQPKGAIAIYGIEPWNSAEVARGAIGHETKGPGKKTSSFRPRSAGCISTAYHVNYDARIIWKGGSWQYTYIGTDDETRLANNHYKNMSGKSYSGHETRKTWDFGQKDGGHSNVT